MHRTIRWCKENAQCLDFPCHQWYGGNPADSGEWIIKLKGPEYIDRLRIKREMRNKISKIEEAEIAKHYKKAHAEILEKRLNQPYGYIDFESWQ